MTVGSIERSFIKTIFKTISRYLYENCSKAERSDFSTFQNPRFNVQQYSTLATMRKIAKMSPCLDLPLNTTYSQRLSATDATLTSHKFS